MLDGLIESGLFPIILKRWRKRKQKKRKEKSKGVRGVTDYRVTRCHSLNSGTRSRFTCFIRRLAIKVAFSARLYKYHGQWKNSFSELFYYHALLNTEASRLPTLPRTCCLGAETFGLRWKETNSAEDPPTEERDMFLGDVVDVGVLNVLMWCLAASFRAKLRKGNCLRSLFFSTAP